MSAPGPYREASPPPKSELEIAIDAAADRIDLLLRKSQEAFLTRGEHRRITRDLEEAKFEHRALVRRAEEAALLRDEISLRARLIVRHAELAQKFGGAWQQIVGAAKTQNQELQAKNQMLRAHLDALERLGVFVSDPTDLRTLDGSDVTCVDCVRAWLDPTSGSCASHPPRSARP